MGLLIGKPYKVKQKDGTWRTVVPEPKEFSGRGRMVGQGSGSNHPHFDLVLLESKFWKP